MIRKVHKKKNLWRGKRWEGKRDISNKSECFLCFSTLDVPKAWILPRMGANGRNGLSQNTQSVTCSVTWSVHQGLVTRSICSHFIHLTSRCQEAILTKPQIPLISSPEDEETCKKKKSNSKVSLLGHLDVDKAWALTVFSFSSSVIWLYTCNWIQ